jgi:hypothetical protein
MLKALTGWTFDVLILTKCICGVYAEENVGLGGYIRDNDVS